ncbi:MAG: VOC family protein [Pseudomonadota bacterium]
MADPLAGAFTAPKFASPDPAAVADWYQQALGFPQADVYAEGAYAIVRREALELHLWQCAERKIAENTSCYCEIAGVDKLDALYADFAEQARAPGFHPGRLSDPPRDFEHGMREFFVWDPAGNLIQFGADLSAEAKDD